MDLVLIYGPGPVLALVLLSLLPIGAILLVWGIQDAARQFRGWVDGWWPLSKERKQREIAEMIEFRNRFSDAEWAAWNEYVGFIEAHRAREYRQRRLGLDW